MTGDKKRPATEKTSDSLSRKGLQLWHPGCRYEDLLGLLEDFLKRGLNGGILKIRHREAGCEIEFHKYILRKGQYGVRLCIILLEINKDCWSQFRNYCSQKNILYTDTMHAHEAAGLMCIDCGHDINKAYALLTVILRDILDIPSNSVFEVSGELISPWMEVIDSPDQKPASPEKGIMLNAEWHRKTFGVGVSSTLALLFSGISYLIGTLGLLWTLLFRDDSWSTLEVYVLSGVFVQIPIFGIISIFFIFVGLVGLSIIVYRDTPKDHTRATGIERTVTRRGMCLSIARRPMTWITAALLVSACISWISF